MRLLALLLFTLGIVLGAVRGIQAEPTPPLTSPSATKLQSLLQSDSGAPHFLPVNEAFRPRLRQSAGELQIDWQVAAGYYLYRDRFKFRLIAPAGVTLGTPRFPDAVEKEDELFGKVAVFDHDFTLTLPTSVTSDAEVLLEVEFQGCAEAGLCYPAGAAATRFGHAPRCCRQRHHRSGQFERAAGPEAGQCPLQCGAGAVLSGRHRAQLHPLRAADDSDSVIDRRRPGATPHPDAGAAADAALCGQHGADAGSGRRPHRALWRQAQSAGLFAVATAAGRLCAAVRAAVAVDVRPL
jgi:hypothetical protein